VLRDPLPRTLERFSVRRATARKQRRTKWVSMANGRFNSLSRPTSSVDYRIVRCPYTITSPPRYSVENHRIPPEKFSHSLSLICCADERPWRGSYRKLNECRPGLAEEIEPQLDFGHGYPAQGSRRAMSGDGWRVGVRRDVGAIVPAVPFERACRSRRRGSLHSTQLRSDVPIERSGRVLDFLAQSPPRLLCRAWETGTCRRLTIRAPARQFSLMRWWKTITRSFEARLRRALSAAVRPLAPCHRRGDAQVFSSVETCIEVSLRLACDGCRYQTILADL